MYEMPHAKEYLYDQIWCIDIHFIYGSVPNIKRFKNLSNVGSAMSPLLIEAFKYIRPHFPFLFYLQSYNHSSLNLTKIR